MVKSIKKVFRHSKAARDLGPKNRQVTDGPELAALGCQPATSFDGGSNADFTYDALPDPTQFVRLLKILPSGDDQISSQSSPTIHCEAIDVSLSEKPFYQALSYTWGNDTEFSEIILNGRRFHITQNLYWFLYHHSCTRDEHRSTLIWIDAICINQLDDDEKTHQVQMMGHIYENAQHVISWLGASGLRDAEKTFSFLNYAGVNYGDRNVKRRYEEDFGGDITVIFDALEELFKLNYWMRAWIVQEVLKAKNVLIRYGSQEMAFDALDFWTLNSNNILFAMGEDRQRSYRPIRRSHAEELFYTRLRETRRLRLDLHHFITHYQHVACRDPRDRVFAFLSLACDKRIKVDYLCSVEDLFFNLVAAYGFNLGTYEVFVKYLGLPWPEKFDLDKLGGFGNALKNSKQTYTMLAKLSGRVSKIWKEQDSITCFRAHLREPEAVQALPYDSIRHQGVIGRGNDNIRPNDVVYRFESKEQLWTFVGFVLRPSISDAEEQFHIVSKVIFKRDHFFETKFEKVAPSCVKAFNRPWESNAFQIKKDDMHSDGTINLRLDRKELVQLLFECDGLVVNNERSERVFADLEKTDSI